MILEEVFIKEFAATIVLVAICLSFRMSEWGYGGENGNYKFWEKSTTFFFYLGPSCWHIVDDGVYGISLSGVRQSPINIETDRNVVETDERLAELHYEYVPGNCTQVGNTGASWKVDVNPEGSSKTVPSPC